MNQTNSISEEKRQWMEEVGIVELKQPMKFLDTGSMMLYSEDYLKNTPLEEIKAGNEKALQRESKTSPPKQKG